MTTDTYRDARNAAFHNMREMGMGVRGAMREAVAYAKTQVSPVSAKDVRGALTVASRACGHMGASEKQIDLIVALCEDRGDFGGLERTTRLNKREASAIIDSIKTA